MIQLTQGILGAVVLAPFVGLSGAIVGYVYAKLADLPAHQVAKVWIIWSVAESSILCIARAFSSHNLRIECLLSATICIISTTLGIRELTKRGLIGDKLRIFIIVFTVLRVLEDLSKCTLNEEKYPP